MYGEKGGLSGEITIARLLQEGGYVTQAIGKWHMGENTESQPQHVGFDDFFGFLGVSDIYTEWRDPYFYPEIVYSEPRTRMVEQANFNKCLVHGRKGQPLENIKEITIPVLSELDKLWADYAVDFIKRMAKSEKPFFLYHCTRAGHFDNYPSPDWRGASQAKHPYKDCLVEVDHILGRIVTALKETDQLENTFIFVTSDNGPEMELWPDSGYTPFRSAKGSTWEGGQRVPGIAYWKGMITPLRESDGVFDQADLFATVLTIAGLKDKVPLDRYIDSVDQTSFMLADEGCSNRKFIYYWLQDELSAVRCGEFKYYRASTSFDYHDTHNVGGLSGSKTTYNYGKLFNLYLDPKEERSYFIRKLVYADVFFDALKKHKETFKAYPAKVIVAAP
jgi:arylsulfatase A-like enzyme